MVVEVLKVEGRKTIVQFNPYPKIHALGYKGTEKLSQLPVYISEKLDGSNVSIHCLVKSVNGDILQQEKYLKFASRTRWMDMESKQFAFFLLWAKEHEQQLLDGLEPGEVLWGEFCNNHNVLKYDRKSPFVMFDFSYTSPEGERIFEPPSLWQRYSERRAWDLVNFHSVNPMCCENLSMAVDVLSEWNKRGSMLGGTIEGIVIKNYLEKDGYGHPLFVKIVNEHFKEDFKKTYAVGDSLEEALCQVVFSEARFRKGVQRLKENENFTNSVKDIPHILSLIQKDIEEESMETVKEFLVKKYWTSAKKLLNYKIVQRYKQELGLGVNDETANT